MKIILVRHGKPALRRFPPLTARAMHEWIDAYHRAGVSDTPPPATQTAVARCDQVLTSDLERAKQSARALGFGADVESNLSFREAGLPHADGTRLRLPPAWWAALFRLRWLMGYAVDSESVEAFHARMAAATDRLEERVRPGAGYWGYGIYEKNGN